MEHSNLSLNKSRGQRAGLIRTLLITISSWAITFYYSFKAIVVVMSSSNPRPTIDRVIRQWSSRLISLINLKVVVKGNFERDESRPCSVMCSHSSAYDIPVSFLAIPGSLRMLAKKELFQIPLFGRAMRLSEFISINRQNKEQARQDLLLAKAKMEDGIMLWVAPEGTRSVDGQLLPFKKGGMHLAIQTQALIIPVAIKDIHRVLPAKRFRMNLNQTIEFRVGNAIDASEYTIESRKALSDAVRDQMQLLLEPEIVSELPQNITNETKPDSIAASHDSSLNSDMKQDIK